MVKNHAMEATHRDPKALTAPVLLRVRQPLLRYPGLELFTTIAVWAPAGTPAPVLERMRKAFEAASKDPQVVSALHETGNERC